MTLEAYTLKVNDDASCEECCGEGINIGCCSASYTNDEEEFIDSVCCDPDGPTIPRTLSATVVYSYFGSVLATVVLPIVWQDVAPITDDSNICASAQPGWYGCVAESFEGADVGGVLDRTKVGLYCCETQMILSYCPKVSGDTDCESPVAHFNGRGDSLTRDLNCSPFFCRNFRITLDSHPPFGVYVDIDITVTE
jgi:hypothetical protein